MCPLKSSQVRDREQRLPIVGGTIVQGLRDAGSSFTQPLDVIGRPPGRLPPQRLESLGVPSPQLRDALAWLPPPHTDNDAAVHQRRSELADGSHGLRRPGGEPHRLVGLAVAADDVSRIAGMAAVEDATKLLIA